MKSGVTKQELISSLEATLKLTREPIERLELVSEDKVIVHFNGGATVPVNIHCDSGMAIIRDVAKAINY